MLAFEGFLLAFYSNPPGIQDCWSSAWCLIPAANSLEFRIAGRQVPKPRCLSPAANSLEFRIAGRQCLSLDA